MFKLLDRKRYKLWGMAFNLLVVSAVLIALDILFITGFYSFVLPNVKKQFVLLALARQPTKNVKTMKETQTSKSHTKQSDEMLSEYNFDYRKARPNRFIEQIDKDRRVVVLDADISRVFTTPESVNTILRALITTMPKPAKVKTFRRSIKTAEK